MKVLSNMLTIWLLLLISNSQIINAKGNVTAKLISYYNVKVCSDKISDRDVLILLDVGEVKKTDSLVGYEFIMSYDTTRIKFKSVIVMNTLSEFFGNEFCNIVSNYEPGKLYGFGATVYPVFGKKPLVGILGTFLGDCIDSTTIYLNSLDFTDEYQNIVNDTIHAGIGPNKVNNQNNFISVKSNIDSIIFKEDILDTLKLNINLNPKNKMDKIDYTVLLSNSNFSILDVINNNSNVKIEKFEKSTNNYFIQTSGNDSLNLNPISLIIKEEFKDTTKICSVNIKAVLNDDCNCIVNTIIDTVSLISKQKFVDVGIDENENEKSLVSLKYKDNLQLLNKSLMRIKSIDIYDLLGTNLLRIAIENEKYINNIDVNLKSGLYFVRINTDKFEIKKTILINN